MQKSSVDQERKEEKPDYEEVLNQLLSRYIAEDLVFDRVATRSSLVDAVARRVEADIMERFAQDLGNFVKNVITEFLKFYEEKVSGPRYSRLEAEVKDLRETVKKLISFLDEMGRMLEEAKKKEEQKVEERKIQEGSLEKATPEESKKEAQEKQQESETPLEEPKGKVATGAKVIKLSDDDARILRTYFLSSYTSSLWQGLSAEEKKKARSLFREIFSPERKVVEVGSGSPKVSKVMRLSKEDLRDLEAYFLRPEAGKPIYRAMSRERKGELRQILREIVSPGTKILEVEG